MKERKPFTRLIKDSSYYRNASVRLDEEGDEEGEEEGAEEGEVVRADESSRV